MNRKSSKLYVGMDVHKESIDIALAEVSGEVRHHGRIGGDMNTLSRTVRKLESLGRSMVFVYEAGPCGYALRARPSVHHPTMRPIRPSSRNGSVARRFLASDLREGAPSEL